MKAVFPRMGALLLVVALAGCATGDRSVRSGADVTSFHLGQPIARGQLAVEAAHPADANSLEYGAYASAVGRQLGRLGWNVAAPASATEQVALITVEQGSREAMRQRSPVSVGLGGGTGGWGGGGVGGGISFGLGGGQGGEIVGTMLRVQIKRRSDGTVFWEGRATTEARADSPEAQRAVAVEKLAEALFRDFPGESGQTIRVE